MLFTASGITAPAILRAAAQAARADEANIPYASAMSAGGQVGGQPLLYGDDRGGQGHSQLIIAMNII